MYKAQLHFHTAESSPCAVASAKTGVQKFKDHQYNLVVVTDHFSKSTLGGPEKGNWEEIVNYFLNGYRQAVFAGKVLNIQVLLGMEIRFPHDENDFLVYGFEPEFLYKNPWLYMKDLKYFYTLAQQEQLFVAQAHPFRTVCTPADPRYLDGVEINNGNCRHASRNTIAKEWAQKNNLIPIVGADFHEPDDLCCNPVYFETKPENEKNIAEMLLRQQYRL